MSKEYGGRERVEEYFRNPEGKIAFVLAGIDPDGPAEFILIVAGEEVVGRLQFDEAREVADFIYSNIPPRPASSLS